MRSIATLERLAAELGVPVGVDDMRLRTALEAASQHIERYTQRRFLPHIATIYHDIDRHDPTRLFLKEDLLVLQAITLADGSPIALSDVVLTPTVEPPASILTLKNNQVFTWRETPLGAVAITGIWGWHDDWANAWRASDDQTLTTLNATETSIAVVQADGADATGETPRFQTGQLIRLGSEYMRVTQVTINPSGADTLTVMRGVNGTTAASHALNAPIDVYQPAYDVEMLTIRWAAWFYKDPDRLQSHNVPESLTGPLNRLRRVWF